MIRALPHVSLQAPERWVNYYVDKFGDEEPYTGNKGYMPCRYPHATYAAMISYFDEQVGKLVDKLKQEGLYENTLIIFTSDNGPTFNGGSDSPWSGNWLHRTDPLLHPVWSDGGPVFCY